jgi:non-ribosomal peptide synthetase component F
LIACRERDLIATLLAVMDIGAVYIPLDALYPSERCAVMMREARARVLVSTSGLSSHLVASLNGTSGGGAAATCGAGGCGGGRAPVAVLDLEDEAALETVAGHAEEEEVACEAGDLVYVIFTSGSTGTPKGVPIRHDALLNFLTAMAEQVRPAARHRPRFPPWSTPARS